jgi:putative hydrolase of the HAD superfamily
MQIQTVFLDAGGVLVNPNWERICESLAQCGVIAAASRLRDAERIVKKRMDTAEMIRSTSDGDRFSAYLRSVIHEAGVAESENVVPALTELHEYNRRWNLWENIPGDVLNTLAKLRDAGMKLVVLSNANGTLRESFKRFGLLDKIDHLFDSSEEGLEKPDSEYFLHALKISGANAETTVHVGDFYHVDVMGARSAGIRPILLDIANLYEGCDCKRIRELAELVNIITTSQQSCAFSEHSE